jgi:hypothetical protein
MAHKGRGICGDVSHQKRDSEMKNRTNDNNYTWKLVEAQRHCVQSLNKILCTNSKFYDVVMIGKKIALIS